MKKNNNMGFTLVELLAVIVIVGILLAIGIVSVVRLISRAREEQKTQQEKTIAMAAESYFQDNRNYLPKTVGGKSTKITLKDLKAAKYLTEDIKNASGESCMDNSIVEVTKQSTTKYVYKTKLYCGKEKPSEEDLIKPTITINYVDENNIVIENTSQIDDVSKAKFIIKYTGGTKDGKKLKISGYNYTILVGVNNSSEYREIYTSGSLNGNNKEEITVSNDNNLKDYIDITSTTRVLIKASAINEDGQVKDTISTLGGDDQSGASGTYNDKESPKCEKVLNQPGANDWINKKSTERERTITVVCDDGNGSGCIRSTFTKTWSVASGEVEKDKITIKDNACNTTDCSVNVYIDRTSPVITIDAFKNTTDANNNTNSVLNLDGTNTNTTRNKANDSAILRANEYKNLNSSFMNASNYSDGVIYVASLSDTYLDSWTWKTNKANVGKSEGGDFDTVGLGNQYPDSKSGNCDNNDCNKIQIGFSSDGYRKGQLIVKDKAGNTATYTIYANIDKTAPRSPTVSYQKINSKKTYAAGSWSNESVNALINKNEDPNDKDISGWWGYKVKHQSNVKDLKGVNTYQVSDQGTNQLSFASCDNAGNCSSYTNEDSIKIDTVAPTCVPTRYKKDGTTVYTGTGWVNSSDGDEYIIVKNVCTDNDNGSGCKNNADQYSYQDDINTNVAGAQGLNQGGTVEDNAGNVTQCPANQTVKIDKTKPTCTFSGTSTTWAKKRTITINVSDNLSGPSEKTKTKNYGGGSTPIAVTTANISVSVSDKAGNTTTCKKNNADIYVDEIAPKVPTITTYVRTDCGTNWNGNTDLSGKRKYNGDWIDACLFSKATGSSDPKATNAAGEEVSASGSVSYILNVTGASSKVTNGIQSCRNVNATGTSTVYFHACDAVGNCSSKASTKLYIDRVAPTCSVNKTTVKTRSGISGNVKCSDSNSGCSTGTQTFSGLKASKTYTVKDKVGNSSKCTVTVSSYSCSIKYKSWTTYTAAYCKNSDGSKHSKTFVIDGKKTSSNEKGTWLSCGGSECNKNNFCGGASAKEGCCYVYRNRTCYK